MAPCSGEYVASQPFPLLYVQANQNDKDLVVNHLRVPAVSRLQKVHNVKIALEALVQRGLTGLKRCDRGQAVGSDDIVDGHREKTVAILWEVSNTHAAETGCSLLVRLYSTMHRSSSVSINQTTTGDPPLQS